MTQRVLEQLGIEAELMPATMAALLKQYARVEGLFSDEQLARRLQVDLQQLRRLRLCLRPNTDSPLFGDEVRQIASQVQMDATLLANIVRQVAAIEAMVASGATTAGRVVVQKSLADPSSRGAGYSSLEASRPQMSADRDRLSAPYAGINEEGEAYRPAQAPPPRTRASAKVPADEHGQVKSGEDKSSEDESAGAPASPPKAEDPPAPPATGTAQE
jgi:hypothetical protein